MSHPITEETVVTHKDILEYLERSRLERIAEMKDVNKRLEGLGITQADIAEDVFYRAMKSMLAQRGIKVDAVDRNVKIFKGSEYDVLAVNGSELVVTEVKTKLRDRDVKDFLDHKLPQFKIEFPQYAGYKIYGGVAGLAVPDAVERYAENNGLFVFTQHGDHGAMIANTQNFQPRAF